MRLINPSAANTIPERKILFSSLEYPPITFMGLMTITFFFLTWYMTDAETDTTPPATKIITEGIKCGLMENHSITQPVFWSILYKIQDKK